MTDRKGFDFRQRMIRERLGKVGRVLLVLSGKGGVGKSVVSATIAALLAKAGYSVGLMDADVYGPSAALLLNAAGTPREGRQGLIPPLKEGVKVMSIDLFAPGRPIPLTGAGVTQAILEMLALTDWGRLDFLVVDMPPATGDAMMTLTSLWAAKLKALVVTTPDALSLSVANRTLELLQKEKIPVLGIMGNMYGRDRGARETGPRVLARRFRVRMVGELPYDGRVRESVERRMMSQLIRTRFAVEIDRALRSRMKLTGIRSGRHS